MPRESRRKRAGSVARPRIRPKSSTLDAASEFSEPLALDIATATIDARSKPVSPVGISRTRKSGRMRSVRSPGARSGVCCEKTKSITPISRNTVNWIRMITPLDRSASRLSRCERAASSRCTMV